MYCGVDVVVREAIDLAEGRVKTSTQAAPVTQRLSEGDPGCVVPIIIIAAVGVICGFASLGQQGDKTCSVFLILGGIMAAIIFANMLVKRNKLTGYSGVCPYCESSITIPPTVQGADCPACKKRIVFRGTKFISVDTPVSRAKDSE